MSQKMKRGPEDISKAMRADLPCSGKQYPTDTEQNVNPQPLGNNQAASTVVAFSLHGRSHLFKGLLYD